MSPKGGRSGPPLPVADKREARANTGLSVRDASSVQNLLWVLLRPRRNQGAVRSLTAKEQYST